MLNKVIALILERDGLTPDQIRQIESSIQAGLAANSQLPKPPEETIGVPTAKLRRFVLIETLKSALAAEEKSVGAEKDELDLAITPLLIESGVPSIKCDGRTVYIHNAVYASPKEEDTREKVVAALKSIPELAMYVAENYNSQSFTSWVKGLADEVEEKCKAEKKPFTEEELHAALPQALQEVLKVGFKRSLRSRKG